MWHRRMVVTCIMLDITMLVFEFVGHFLVHILYTFFFFFLMIRRPPRSTLSSSSAASDVYKRQVHGICLIGLLLVAPSYEITAAQLIPINEGSRSCMYYDTMGNPTIGIGYNLNNGDASQMCSECGIPYEEARSGKYCLSQTQINCLFQPSLDSAINCAKGTLSNYYNLCENAQAVAADMSYNLGCGGYRGFSTFNSYLNNQEYDSAANDLSGTLWCGQVKSRCTRDEGYLRDC
eukprot:TRINITY_DN407_c0_g1_i12.p2 TRINITY_DN407_c0_g1~~TRINITY_DN407_c0_g1_i12.p2  ORF type:complete len:234 (+),score=30.68 TRINITY_DN407_c0_g1_i12:2-703(+)